MADLLDFITNLLESNGFMPRWICGNWTETHGWLYIFSNISIWAAYFTIPLIFYLLLRKKKDVPFFKLIILFSLFIFFCGMTHFLDALVFWIPIYRLNALVLFCTGIISWITVYFLYKNFPKLMAYQSPEKLNQIINKQTEELKKAYIDLKESENSFRTLVNKNPDSITKIGKDFRYKFVNESMKEISTIDIKDFLGKTPQEAFPNHPLTEEFVNRLKKVFESKAGVQYETISLSQRAGLKTFSMEMIPLFDEFGEVENVLTLTKDITNTKENELRLNKTIFDLNQLTKRLEYKRKTLQDFSYIVSHNLRSPVSNLMSLIHLYKLSDDANFKLDLIQKFIIVSERLALTVEDLTEVVNINQNKDLEREDLTFAAVLDHTVKSISELIISAGAEIVSDFENCSSIEYPKVYLESIFLNLLTNALKYSSPKRKPIIKLKSIKDNEGVITLICEDNGLGIDMKLYGDKLFSLHKTFHEHPDSRGVGLFITKNQINSLGGAIWAESEVDKGTKFIIQFNKFSFI